MNDVAKSNHLKMTGSVRELTMSTNAIWLWLFPFSHSKKVNVCLSSLPIGSTSPWDQRLQQFLDKYFPPSKSAKLQSGISNYVQYEIQSLYKMWERLQNLIINFLYHEFPIWQLVLVFYSGLSSSNHTMVDTTIGGAIIKKTPKKAYQLMEEMTVNSYQWQIGDQHIVKRKDQADINKWVIKCLLVCQVEVMRKSMDLMFQLMAAQITQATPSPCVNKQQKSEDCQVGNQFAKSGEEVNYVGGRLAKDPYSNI